MTRLKFKLWVHWYTLLDYQSFTLKNSATEVKIKKNVVGDE